MNTYEIVKNAFFSDMIKKTDEDGNECWIPTDPVNPDYQAYLAAQSTPSTPEGGN
jgi:hypothetical protein